MTAAGAAAPHLYNLFPRLAGDVRHWGAHARRAAAMGFDHLYLNPVHFPGFSGSCYAVKDFFRVDPLLLPPEHPDKHWDEPVRGDGGLAVLQAALAEIRAAGLQPVMDLVLNHTARDSPLVAAHPTWYVRDAAGSVQSPSAIDPADARQVTVWGDLAEVDNAHSPDRDALWAFWREVVRTWAEAGFTGFRCDAAYKVPAPLWAELQATARSVHPQAQFFAETLGARLEEIDALRDAGLDFVFNSSKWWNFSEPWCLEQQARMPAGWRSISFAESHDTPRLWAECGGRAAVVRQRYAFAAGFATGVLVPVGFEYGFERRIDVVTTRDSDWETPRLDLSPFLAHIHALRRQLPALASDDVRAVTALDTPVLVLEKRAGAQQAFVVVNKDQDGEQRVALPEAARGRRIHRVCRERYDADEEAAAELALVAAEVVYIA
jgi:starch synthase (maltosyl-transferring)